MSGLGCHDARLIGNGVAVVTAVSEIASPGSNPGSQIANTTGQIANFLWTGLCVPDIRDSYLLHAGPYCLEAV